MIELRGQGIGILQEAKLLECFREVIYNYLM
jgi:hypothetical protein